MKSQLIRICQVSLKYIFPEEFYCWKKIGLKLMTWFFYFNSRKSVNKIENNKLLWSNWRKIIKVRLGSDEMNSVKNIKTNNYHVYKIYQHTQSNWWKSRGLMKSSENKDTSCVCRRGGPTFKSAYCSCRRPEFHLSAKNRQLLTACNSRSGESDVSFWFPVIVGPHTHP